MSEFNGNGTPDNESGEEMKLVAMIPLGYWEMLTDEEKEVFKKLLTENGTAFEMRVDVENKQVFFFTRYEDWEEDELEEE